MLIIIVVVVVVQVEYRACVVIGDCWGLLRELLQSIVGGVAESLPPALAGKQDDIYVPSLTMLQYLDIFNTFRKGTPVSEILR